MRDEDVFKLCSSRNHVFSQCFKGMFWLEMLWFLISFSLKVTKQDCSAQAGSCFDTFLSLLFFPPSFLLFLLFFPSLVARPPSGLILHHHYSHLSGVTPCFPPSWPSPGPFWSHYVFYCPGAFSLYCSRPLGPLLLLHYLLPLQVKGFFQMSDKYNVKLVIKRDI